MNFGEIYTVTISGQLNYNGNYKPGFLEVIGFLTPSTIQNLQVLNRACIA